MRRLTVFVRARSGVTVAMLMIQLVVVGGGPVGDQNGDSVHDRIRQAAAIASRFIRGPRETRMAQRAYEEPLQLLQAVGGSTAGPVIVHALMLADAGQAERLAAPSAIGTPPGRYLWAPEACSAERDLRASSCHGPMTFDAISRLASAWRWLPILVWDAIIFALSVTPNLRVAQAADLDFVVRKAGHMAVFAALAVLV
jgi:hypothetical protein